MSSRSSSRQQLAVVEMQVVLVRERFEVAVEVESEAVTELMLELEGEFVVGLGL